MAVEYTVQYTKYGSWLSVGGLKTKFWTQADKDWLDKPETQLSWVKTNSKGHLVLPFGHKDGTWLYPQHH